MGMKKERMARAEGESVLDYGVGHAAYCERWVYLNVLAAHSNRF